MNWNFEKFLVKKEVTDWTFVVPTKVLNVVSNALDLTVEQQKLSQIEWSMYGPTRSVLGKKRVAGSVDSYATPGVLGFVFDSMFGAPLTITAGWHFIHEYDYTWVSTTTYTVEATKWTSVLRTSGVKVNDFSISVDNAALKITSNLLGRYAIGVHKITGNSLNTFNFSETVFFTTADSVDFYNAAGTLIAGNIPLASVTSTSITVGTPVAALVGDSVTLSKRTWTATNEDPVQFLEQSTVSVNGTNISVYNFGLTATNNITADEGFRSGSSYAQSLNTKMRTISGTITVDNLDVVPFLAAHTSGSEVLLSITTRNALNDAITVTGLATIDTVPTQIQTNTTLTSNIGFSFISLSSLRLDDAYADHTY